MLATSAEVKVFRISENGEDRVVGEHKNATWQIVGRTFVVSVKTESGSKVYTYPEATHRLEETK